MPNDIGKQHGTAAFIPDQVPCHPILGHFNAKLVSISVPEFLTEAIDDELI